MINQFTFVLFSVFENQTAISNMDFGQSLQILRHPVIYAGTILLESDLYNVITDPVDVDVVCLPRKSIQILFPDRDVSISISLKSVRVEISTVRTSTAAIFASLSFVSSKIFSPFRAAWDLPFLICIQSLDCPMSARCPVFLKGIS